MRMAHLVARYWAAEDVRALPEDGKGCECLVRCPDPVLRQHALGELRFSPADIGLQPGTLVQPDLLVYRTVGSARVQAWRDITGLLLATAVLSPDTARRDRGLQREFYPRAGVGEYWIVDLAAQRVAGWTPGSERSEILRNSLCWSPRGDDSTVAISGEISLPGVVEDILGEEGARPSQRPAGRRGPSRNVGPFPP